MFNRSKIIKKTDVSLTCSANFLQVKVTELEEEIAKTLQHYESNNADIQAHLKLFYINSAEEVEYSQADGTKSKYILVRTPFRSLAAFRKVGKQVIEHLEAKFRWPVVIAANRTIISTRGKYELPNALSLLSESHSYFSDPPRFLKETSLPYPQGCPQRNP